MLPCPSTLSNRYVPIRSGGGVTIDPTPRLGITVLACVPDSVLLSEDPGSPGSVVPSVPPENARGRRFCRFGQAIVLVATCRNLVFVVVLPGVNQNRIPLSVLSRAPHCFASPDGLYLFSGVRVGRLVGCGMPDWAGGLQGFSQGHRRHIAGLAVMNETSIGESRFELRATSGPTPVVFPLALPGPIVIGRSSNSDLQLDDPSVSRRHAGLTYRLPEGEDDPPFGEWLLADLQSSRGTWAEFRPPWFSPRIQAT